MNTLSQFLKKFIATADITTLENAFDVRRQMKKKEFLLEPGGNSSFLAFVEKGTFRVFFYNQEGVEVTVWFSWEGMMIGDLLAFYQDTRAKFYVQAIETSVIKIISRKKLLELYATNMDYVQFGRKYAEYVAASVMERMLSLQTKSAEERYLELLSVPNYMQKIPLKYLASYLGITDSSLSRIRKNIP